MVETSNYTYPYSFFALLDLSQTFAVSLSNQTRRAITQNTRKSIIVLPGFVEWLSLLCYCSLAPGHSYQRKKTSLLLLSALLETCTDTWSPEKKKGQPPGQQGLP